jgi:hypothetical protein
MVMAYFAFHDFGGMATVRQDHGGATAQVDADLSQARLTDLEWSVVAIARNDSRSSLRQPGRSAAVLRLLFDKPNPRLADDRLEALRRLAVLAWLDGPEVHPDEVGIFLSAGFTREQFETICTSIGAAREP